MKFTLIACLSLLPIVSAKLVKLDDSNFHEMTEDKIVFVKFFAPWCGHCKSMAADWEKLADEITDPNILIAEVDCTADESSETCEDNDVGGFPSLKFGEVDLLEDYEGARDYEDMLKFARENLKPGCSPKNIDLCDAEQKSVIEKYMPMSVEDLENSIEDIEDMLEKLDSAFEDSTGALENDYENFQKVKDDKQKQAKKAANYSNLKAVLKTMIESGSNSEL